MKDQDNRTGQQASGGADDQLQTLFQHVGTREKPPAGLEQGAREALRAEWARTVARRRKQRLLAGLAVAATVVIALGAVLRMAGAPPAPGPAEPLAVVENQLGTARLYGVEPGTDSKRLRVDSPLMSAQSVETGSSSAVALRWFHGQSIRLDQNTRIRLDSASGIRLQRGRIYVDTATHTAGAEALAIATPAGPVRHVGTRYMAAVSDSGTVVSVREGQVALEQPGNRLFVAGGEQLTVNANGQSSREPIDPWGEPWSWAERVTPAFDSDGKSIADLVEWVAGETGHTVEYLGDEAENHARGTVLRGRLEMEPMKALSMITRTSGMNARVTGGRIILSLADDD